MATRDSVLLIIKQNEGINYNSLVSKISSEYSSLDSAKAALSRDVKNLLALGFIKREEDYFFLTEKGKFKINSELKNRLLLNLNRSLSTKPSHTGIDSMIELLHVLFERSKEEPDLLKNAKACADFFVSDLEIVSIEIDQRLKHLSYLKNVFSEQLIKLKEFDFNDFFKLEFNDLSIKRVLFVSNDCKLKDVLIEFSDNNALEKVLSVYNLKSKGKNVSFPTAKLPNLLKLIKLRPEIFDQSLNLYFKDLTITIDFPFISFIGPYSKINLLKK
ncbi:MAG: hypothetical protein ABH821_02785 [archaeon]